ncbi:hypothetical protein V6245_01995 [Salinibacterium amurskyense]|uniref:DUF1700 domain-containing protein n=1 Tax=Salinibacterium amurskyense TaxID=205941 RepID=UPI00311D712D
MTPTSLHDRAAEQRDYLKVLNAELAVLPPALREDIFRDVNEHLEDAQDDPRPFSESIGAPSDIARSGLEQSDLTAGKVARPPASLLSKRLQLITAAIYTPLTIVALLGLTQIVPVGFRFSILLQFIPLFVLIIPQLFARWTSWWLISLFCTALYVSYFIAAFSLVTVFFAAGWPIPFPAFVIPFLIGWQTLLVIHAPALALLVTALVRAPAVLRAGRAKTTRD